ncbi:MAG: hypothetical protein WAT43_07095, partial [Chitinophagales bacterium]
CGNSFPNAVGFIGGNAHYFGTTIPTMFKIVGIIFLAMCAGFHTLQDTDFYIFGYLLLWVNGLSDEHGNS